MQKTEQHPNPDVPAFLAHEHGWCVESRHTTSIGYVLYVRCADCGTRRVDFQPCVATPPESLSAEFDVCAPSWLKTGESREGGGVMR